MIFKLNRRLSLSAIAMLLAAAMGTCAGYLQGCISIKHAAQKLLADDATHLSATLKSISEESYGILAQANSMGYPPCSDAEIAQLRQLIYHSVNFREIGRMRDGKILCSALFGRENLPQARFKPAYHYMDGTAVFWDLAPYAISGIPVFVRQRGNFFVVESPDLSTRIHRMRTNHDVFTANIPNLSNGPRQSKPRRIAGAILDRNATGLVGDALYATHCSPHSPTCVTSYGSLSASLLAGQGELALRSALGGLCGGFLVLAFLAVYWNGRAMAPQLRRAIREDRLTMVYQPIVDIAAGRPVGAEALVRWTDEDGLAVSPAIFVKMAEERGFAGELTALVVRHVLHDFGEWMRAHPDFQLNVNITASDLTDENFFPMLEAALAEARVAPRQLSIELTESSTVHLQTAIPAIRRLRERGHTVQLDDFGTGYSSLAYLKDLSVDAIKIDKAFTQAISTHAVIGTILPQMLMLAETLDLQATVEGIETAEQAAFFASMPRPVLGQGWFFGRPAPAAELCGRLSAQKDRAAAAHSVVA